MFNFTLNVTSEATIMFIMLLLTIMCIIFVTHSLICSLFYLVVHNFNRIMPILSSKSTFCRSSFIQTFSVHNPSSIVDPYRSPTFWTSPLTCSFYCAFGNQFSAILLTYRNHFDKPFCNKSWIGLPLKVALIELFYRTLSRLSFSLVSYLLISKAYIRSDYSVTRHCT